MPPRGLHFTPKAFNKDTRGINRDWQRQAYKIKKRYEIKGADTNSENSRTAEEF